MRLVKLVRDTPNSRAIFDIFGFFWARAAAQASSNRLASKLVDLAMVGGGKSVVELAIQNVTKKAW
jgi:hypothetical protein